MGQRREGRRSQYLNSWTNWPQKVDGLYSFKCNKIILDCIRVCKKLMHFEEAYLKKPKINI